MCERERVGMMMHTPSLWGMFEAGRLRFRSRKKRWCTGQMWGVNTPQKALESSLDSSDVLSILHHEFAELEDELKLLRKALLELIDLLRRELLERKLENFLRQELEDLHIVPAQCLVGLAALNNLRDEILPVLRPLLLENLVRVRLQFSVYTCHRGCST